MHLLSTLVCLLASISMAVAGDCCKASSSCTPAEVIFGGYCPSSCEDGTGPTPCCGRGPCNVFCCNCDNGCRGTNGLANPSSQAVLGQKSPATCGYDSTFDDVSGVGSESITLGDYLIWAKTYQPASINNASLIEAWISFFHSFDANGDGKLDFEEMHRPKE